MLEGDHMWLRNIIRKFVYTVILALLPDTVAIEGETYDQAVIHDDDEHPGITGLVYNGMVYALIHRSKFEKLAADTTTEMYAVDSEVLAQELLRSVA